MLIARIVTDGNIGFLGHSHNVMVVHLHRLLAKGIWKAKLREFWPYLANLVRVHDVKVIMGDFNMALLMVVPELRSCGVHLDLGAY